jgi:hypothetical protein
MHSPWHYPGSSEVLSLGVELVEIMLGWRSSCPIAFKKYGLRIRTLETFGEDRMIVCRKSAKIEWFLFKDSASN